MKKQRNNILIKSDDLPTKMKEAGFEIDTNYAQHIPYGYFGGANREGLLQNGKIPEVYYYDPFISQKYLKDLSNFNLREKLKERGYELNPEWIRYIPTKMENGIYTYDLEKVITFLNSTNKHNLKSKLEEKGYHLSNEEMEILFFKAPCDNSKFGELGFGTYDLDKVIEYLNAPNDINIKALLKERGYEVDDLMLEWIKHEYQLITYKNNISCYNLEAVIKYIQFQKQNVPITDMGKLLNSKDKDKNFFGNNVKDFYNGVNNLYSRFPISKWYAEKYNTIPDNCFIGQIYIEELLNDESFKLRWVFKHFVGYDDVNDYPTRVNVLRVLKYERKCEYICEALIEIEDGMFLILSDGYLDRSNGCMCATAILFYKEGIHDTTDILRYVADKGVIHYDKGTLGLLYHNANGFNTNDFTIPEPQIDFDLHYNEGFEKIHNTILSTLSEDEGKGLVLLHGKPGTGKTTYIRYLINRIHKNKIFVPPNLTELLSDPGFIPFLMNNSNSVLFVEDAENVLRSREDGSNNQAVSNILNITDGLLSDCLNIQIVATFNTHIKNIDKALLRKGRLIAQYEFKDLAQGRAEKLADSLKVWLDDTENMTLADIYASKK